MNEHHRDVPERERMVALQPRVTEEEIERLKNPKAAARERARDRYHKRKARAEEAQAERRRQRVAAAGAAGAAAAEMAAGQLDAPGQPRAC